MTARKLGLVAMAAVLTVTAACSSAPIAKVQAAFNGNEVVVGVVIDVTPYIARSVITAAPELAGAQAGGEIVNEGVIVQVQTEGGVVVVRCAGDYLEKGTTANRCASRLTENAKLAVSRDASGNAVAEEVD